MLEGYCCYVLSGEVKDSLEGLPMDVIRDGARLVHGSPVDPERIAGFVTSVFAARKAFEAFDQKVCFIGHTHNPRGYCMDENSRIFLGRPEGMRTRLLLEEGKRYLVDVGSVGVPEWTEPCFVIYDTDEQSVTWHRMIDGCYSSDAEISLLSLKKASP